MGLQRIDDGVEREVRLLGVAGISFSDVIRNMVTVIKSDEKLTRNVREMAFLKKDGERETGASMPPVPEELNGRRARKGEVTPSSAYKPFILRLLLNAPGHSLRAKRALRLLEPMMRPQMKPSDYASLPKTGVPRWPNKAQWGRQRLVEEGLIHTVEEAGRGVWKLTPAGVKAAQKVK
jgi:hypothetical protein